MSAHETYNLRIGDRDEDEHHHVYLTISDWKNSFNADCSEYFEMSGICKPERAQAIVTAVNSYSALQDRVAVLEGENARTQALFTAARKTSAALSGRVAELEEALKPFARIAEQRGKAPAGENVLVSIDMCRDARAALQGGSNG